MPNVVVPLDKHITIKTPKPLGVTAKVYVHEVARRLQSYHHPIAYDATGNDATGTPIAVNTIGRWLFGVPGYTGHLRIVADDSSVALYYPAQAHQLIHDFIESLQMAMEGPALRD